MDADRQCLELAETLLRSIDEKRVYGRYRKVADIICADGLVAARREADVLMELQLCYGSLVGTAGDEPFRTFDDGVAALRAAIETRLCQHDFLRNDLIRDRDALEQACSAVGKRSVDARAEYRRRLLEAPVECKSELCRAQRALRETEEYCESAGVALGRLRDENAALDEELEAEISRRDRAEARAARLHSSAWAEWKKCVNVRQRVKALQVELKKRSIQFEDLAGLLLVGGGSRQLD